MNVLTQLQTSLAERYDVEREIASGGMATVYLARDLRHDRRVALKVLKPELGAVLGAERFLSEIRVTANLQHPNLLPLFDSGEANGLLFYVMPFVDGETLRQRLDHEKQLPLDDAIRIASAVADALEYAHGHGVIHRDLKPENILLQRGQPVVSDFGIALAVSHAGGERVTQTGLSLGTPQYMSPEQATGDRAVDQRTDVYSLGAVTYEMIGGEPPHLGTSAQAIIAKLLTEVPRPLEALRPSTPEHVAEAVRVALSKLPADRWKSAAQFSDALSGRVPTTVGRPAAGDRRALRRWRGIAVGSLVLCAAASAFAVRERLRARDALPVQFELLGPAPSAASTDAVGSQVQISLDGSVLVMRGQSDSGVALYRRALGDTLQVRIPGTRGAGAFSISPDGAWIAFVADSDLRKLPITGGTPTTLAKAARGAAGISWGGTTIVFGLNRRLFRVDASGGTLSPIAQHDSGVQRRFPRVLEDGDHVLFVRGARNLDSAMIGVLSLRNNQETVLPLRGVYPAGVLDGRLYYVRADGALMAVGFDARAMTIHGEPAIVRGGLSVSEQSGAARVAIARGVLVVGTKALGRNEAHRVDIATGQATLLFARPSVMTAPRVSPDGKRIAFVDRGFPHSEIWVYDLSAHTALRLAEGTNFWNLHPSWTPDGRKVVYTSMRDSMHASAWWQSADGSSAPNILIPGAAPRYNEVRITPDGRTAYFRIEGTTAIGYRSLSGDTTTKKIVSGSFTTMEPSVSPDGKWLTYMSTETGDPRVYVTRFPGPPSKWVVSDGFGVEPLWSPDGKTIYYRTDRDFVAARVNTTGDFSVVSRQTLFRDVYVRPVNHHGYDITPDGKSLVVVGGVPTATKYSVSVGWQPETSP